MELVNGGGGGGDCEALFRTCDQEDKGFITKRDMLRLRKDMDMEPEQLEDVFDTLDVDGNGYLTLNEFSQGNCYV